MGIWWRFDSERTKRQRATVAYHCHLLFALLDISIFFLHVWCSFILQFCILCVYNKHFLMTLDETFIVLK